MARAEEEEQPWWHPARHAARRTYLLARQRITAGIRAFFAERGFVEAEVPALQVSPGLEPHLKAFRTELERPDGSRLPRYLHTSPEFTAKKLLAAGEERLFILARVFRNGERAATHHPEFTLLEWYRAEAPLEALIEDCVALLRFVAKVAGRRRLIWQGQEIDPFRPFPQISLQEAFRRHAGIDLLATTPDPARPDAERLRAAAQASDLARGIRLAADDDWHAMVTKLQLALIEPHLGVKVPAFLTDYPISMAALARPKPEEPRLAERFELYAGGLELANAFGELTDPAEQRHRFQADMDLKEQLYGERYPIDEDFLTALASMPPASGIALGLDRLVMLATGAAHIEDVLWAPVAD